MNSVMPSTCARAGCSRRRTSLALIFRSASGLRLMRIRPLFNVVLMPSTPMKDVRLSTAGSWRMTSASACCRAAIAVKEMFSLASEMPWITPVSCTGKNPLGTMRYSRIVAPSVSTATTSVAPWRLSTHPRVRA